MILFRNSILLDNNCKHCSSKIVITCDNVIVSGAENYASRETELTLINLQLKTIQQMKLLIFQNSMELWVLLKMLYVDGQTGRISHLVRLEAYCSC